MKVIQTCINRFIIVINAVLCSPCSEILIITLLVLMDHVAVHIKTLCLSNRDPVLYTVYKYLVDI